MVGLARSGIAAARLLREAGRRCGRHRRKAARRPDRRGACSGALGVRLVDSRTEPLREAELVVVSPGVPLDGEQLAVARRRGVAIIGELELGWRASDAEAVAITGTNGKTTTTALTGALLARQRPACPRRGQHRQPADRRGRCRVPREGWLVLEVSSFQLETIVTFRPRVAAVLNVTPDHLDRHRTLAAYTAAKARIFENQGPGDGAVLNEDDAGARALAPAVRG